ncbi:MAG TPA: S41 family peptidase [Polyangiaceae bacterium]|jgi:carboxyl-terminal processing protease|nr:S41 family peptidase [Polyangiaceae bacterium]
MLGFTVAMRARHDSLQLMSLLTLGLSLAIGCHPRAERSGPGARADATATNSAVPAEPPKLEIEPETERPLQVPKGDPPRVSCAQARAIVAEVRSKLPVEPPRVDAEQFADLWVDWFDPHGLWSAAPDSPLADAAHAHAPELLNEIERATANAPCSAALGLGSATKHWVDALRGVFEKARSEAKAPSLSRALAGVNEPAFEDESVSHPARVLAADLGTRIGQFAGVAPELGDESAGAALSRFFPDYSDEQWSEVVLAAAVRAYVPAIDPHGEWAPLEEEWALFEGDPIDDTEPTLWSDMVRTALGARIVAGARAPLELDDLVLSVDGVTTAGLSVEQIEQLARVDPPEGQSGRKVRLLRGNSLTPLELSVSFPQDSNEAGDALDATRVRYGDGTALVIPVSEVGDHLGDDLANVLSAAREDGAPVGVVLDLRGNGGGSTDGAAAAIGLFLPGVPMFPLIHRGVVSEIMRAQEPDPDASWKGPLAVLVDGYTASAAEMIAGAIDSYGRGPLLGSHTFGKGCVQEYFDDHSGQGVLRLTTLLVALPDGSALQQVGLEPEWALGLPEADEREADLVGSPHGASGPDVRNRAEMAVVPWPSAHGHVGPCEDAAVCRALSRLGTGVPVRRSRAANPSQSHTRRAPRPRPVLGDAEHSAHGFTQSREGRGTSPR